MRIALGFDHAGFDYKPSLIKYLSENGYEFVDYGTNSSESCDYPDFAAKVAKAVQQGECDFGILVCGTGIGMSITANKFKGIRCALCNDAYSAEVTRLHNDANILAMGRRVISEELMLRITDIFLHGKFMGAHHVKRLEKLKRIEEEQNLN